MAVVPGKETLHQSQQGDTSSSMVMFLSMTVLEEVNLTQN